MGEYIYHNGLLLLLRLLFHCRHPDRRHRGYPGRALLIIEDSLVVTNTYIVRHVYHPEASTDSGILFIYIDTFWTFPLNCFINTG